MTDELQSEAVTPLNPLALQLAEAFVRASGGRAEIVRGDQQNWLAIEEITTTIAFVEAEGDELRVVPFVGDSEVVRVRPYVVSIGPSWLDRERELVIDSRSLGGSSHQEEVLGYLKAALEYWTSSMDSAGADPRPPAAPAVEAPTPDLAEVDFTESAAEEAVDVGEAGAEADVPTVVAQMHADISDQWSWASSAARIPQISDLTVALSESVDHARVSVSVSDADIQFGAKIAFEGALPAGTSVLGSVHVPLSARAMSQIEERRGAGCAITLEDVNAARVLARADESIDIQPRDLWFWKGDPRRAEQRQRLISRYDELVALAREDPDRADIGDIATELDWLKRVVQEQDSRSATLSRSLLASFVRPNHPEISILAREAADMRGRDAGEASFHAFQLPERDRAQRQIVAESVEHSITARCTRLCVPATSRTRNLLLDGTTLAMANALEITATLPAVVSAHVWTQRSSWRPSSNTSASSPCWS